MSDGVGRRPGGRQIIPRPPDWAPGPPPPWLDGAEPSLDRLLANLEPDAAPVVVRDELQRPAAVLVVLHEGEYGPEVLLTRRSWELSSHRGEMSFPGGRMDPGETPTDTALREADEEVALDPTEVTLHGELRHFSTFASRSYIVPKVATVERRPELVARTIEVDRIMWVPLKEFIRADTYRSEHWHTVVTEGELHFFELDDETVWGVTARMMMDLLVRSL